MLESESRVVIVQLLPYDGIGGVEAAAMSCPDGRRAGFEFRKQYVFSSAPRGLRAFDPRAFVGAALRLRDEAPDVLVLSLWRAVIVGLLVKLTRPCTQLVLFLHLPEHAHFVDRLLTTLAGRLSIEIWADSRASLEARLPSVRRPTRVISFVSRRLAPVTATEARPSFVYWGRLSAQKGIPRALAVFAAIRERVPSAHFDVIGPDGGDLQRCLNCVRALGLEKSVRFHGAMAPDRISEYASRASFYLQTSITEGMAMSVVESMQLGLVPIVTAVGEIANYCEHERNAIVVRTDDTAAVDSVERLLGDSGAYANLRRNAIETWHERAIYREDFEAACSQLAAELSVCS